MSGPRHKACAVSIDDHVVVTGGTLLGLGKTKPSWLAEIGSRTASAFDGRQWTKLPPMNRAKVSCSTASSFSNILSRIASHPWITTDHLVLHGGEISNV